MATEKLNKKLENKTCTSLQIKNHKTSHEIRLIRQQTQHKNPAHTYLIFLIPLTTSAEKIVNLLHGFTNQDIQMYLVSVDHNSMAAYLTRNHCEGF